MTWATFSEDHQQAIAEIMVSSSDTVAAIVGGTYLADSLRRTLSERFRDDKDINQKILKERGALGSAGAQVDVLYMLYAFEKDIRDAMYGICNIRNFFAHNLGASFDSNNNKLNKFFENLVLHENKKYYPHHIYGEASFHEIEEINNRRDQFVVNLKLCLLALMHNRVSHCPWTTKRRTKKELAAQKRKWKAMDRGGTNFMLIVPTTSPRKPLSPKTSPAPNPSPSRKGRKHPPESSRA